VTPQSDESAHASHHSAKGRRAQHRFPGKPEKIKEVRQWLAGVLPTDCPVRDEAVLLVDELAANACKHTASGKPGGSFEVSVSVSAALVRVEVADEGSDTEPQLRSAALDSEFGSEWEFELPEAGRGLQLVAALATRWGVTGDHSGRTVWCELALPTE